MGWWESGFNCWGVRGLALVLFLFYVNVSGMRPLSRFLLPAFDDPFSLGYPPRRMVYPATLGDCLLFPCGA